jgi:hypothetical protein
VFAEWRERTVAFDYHVDVDRHYYSVPHALVGHGVWARFSATTVEVFFRSERVASHVRSYQRGAHTTLPEHMPKSHRAHAEWSPKRLIHWGSSIGMHTGEVVEHLLRDSWLDEQGGGLSIELPAMPPFAGLPRYLQLQPTASGASFGASSGDLMEFEGNTQTR